MRDREEEMTTTGQGAGRGSSSDRTDVGVLYRWNQLCTWLGQTRMRKVKYNISCSNKHLNKEHSHHCDGKTE